MTLGQPPASPSENIEQFGNLGLLPESEVDETKITRSPDNADIGLYEYEGRKLPVFTAKGKQRVVSQINGKHMSHIDTQSAIIYQHNGSFRGIAYFEDNLGKPTLIIDGTEITHIDDFDLSDVDSLTIDWLGRIKATKQGQTFEFETEDQTLSGTTLSQEKFKRKQRFEKQIESHGLDVYEVYIDIRSFYKNMDEAEDKITSVLEGLTGKEKNIVKTKNLRLCFSGSNNRIEGEYIWINVTSTPIEEMIRKTKDFIAQFADKDKEEELPANTEEQTPVEPSAPDFPVGEAPKPAPRQPVITFDPPPPGLPLHRVMTFDPPLPKPAPALPNPEGMTFDPPLPRSRRISPVFGDGLDAELRNDDTMADAGPVAETTGTTETKLGDLEFVPDAEIDQEALAEGDNTLVSTYEYNGKKLPIIRTENGLKVLLSVKGKNIEEVYDVEYDLGNKPSFIAKFEDGKTLPVHRTRLIEEIEGEEIEHTVQFSSGSEYENKFSGFVTTNKSNGETVIVDDEQIIRQIEGRKILKISGGGIKIHYKRFTGIAYFEDAPSVPTLVRDGPIIKYIDDLDLSNASNMSFSRRFGGDIELEVTIDGQTKAINIPNRAPVKDGILSIKKHEQRLNTQKKIQQEKGVKVMIPERYEFYENQEEWEAKIVGAMNMLTLKELNFIQAENLGINFVDVGGYDSEDDYWINIDAQEKSAEQITAKIRKLLQEYGQRKSIEVPKPETTQTQEKQPQKEKAGLKLSRFSPKLKIPEITGKKGQLVETLRDLTRTKAVRVLAMALIVGGVATEVVIQANKSTSVNSALGTISKKVNDASQKLSDAEKEIDKEESAEQEKSIEQGKSTEKKKQKIDFKSLQDAIEQGYIIIIEDKKYTKKGYTWALSEEEALKLPQDDPKRYSVIEE